MTIRVVQPQDPLPPPVFEYRMDISDGREIPELFYETVEILFFKIELGIVTEEDDFSVRLSDEFPPALLGLQIYAARQSDICAKIMLGFKPKYPAVKIAGFLYVTCHKKRAFKLHGKPPYIFSVYCIRLRAHQKGSGQKPPPLG
ncbi:hypothetical protein SDC9_93539 [bioreactor metagenome]|uniref:Uncharacterized protein n=1 Tax=bioreactor metagenome TaxID=1076179 RepID=A0A645A1B5_9ZZZZ